MEHMKQKMQSLEMSFYKYCMENCTQGRYCIGLVWCFAKNIERIHEAGAGIDYNVESMKNSDVVIHCDLVIGYVTMKVFYRNIYILMLLTHPSMKAKYTGKR